jgi:hypothetical protein
MKIKFLVVIVIFLSQYTLAQNNETFNPNIFYPIDSTRVWTKELMAELSKNQPGFYRYTSKSSFDRIIDSTINTINKALKPIDFYRKLKPLIAKIGCLHTGIALSKPYSEYINENYSLFPLETFIDENRKVYVTKNHSDNSEIKVKSELLSINNIPILDIVTTLTNAIPSDGYNQTLKILALNHRFPFWYQSVMYLGNDYEIEIKTKTGIKTYNLKGVGKEKFESIESLSSQNEEQLAFKIENNTGFLTVKTFASTQIKANNQKFNKFIKETFENLKEKNIKNLVVDLRYNTGGTDSNASFLASFFFDEPFRYWDRIEVTKNTADQITGATKLFYRKPEKVDSMYLWKKARQTKEFDYYEIQEPSKNNFNGNVYLLTNGFCMSSCADFIAILSSNNKAIVIGQETGGGYQGNTSGMMPEEPINAFMSVTIPLHKYTNYVDLKKNFGRGTIPDYKIYPTLEQWIAKKDLEMEYIKKHITNSDKK